MNHSKMNLTRTTLSAAVILALSACSSTPMTKQNSDDIKDTRAHLESLLAEANSQTEAAKASNFSEQNEPTISIKPLGKEQQEAKEKEWLTSITGITLNPAEKAPVSATAIIRMLRERGINIVTALPLDFYSYNGFGVTNVNAETALMVFLGAMGLDYDLDNARHLVTVEPMKPQMWILNIGDRRTSFNAATDASSSSSSSTSNNGAQASATSQPGQGALPGLAPNNYGTPGTGPTPGSMQPNSPGGANGAGSTTANANNITTDDNPWSKLSTELTNRLSILVPKINSTTTGSSTTVPGLTKGQQNQPGQPGDVGSMYNTQVVGKFSINPDTGAVVVQAPKYILKDLNEYLTKTQDQYNTVIAIDSELVTLSTNNNISEGIDWSVFNNFSGGGYTSAIQNNILGGTVLTSAVGTGSVTNTLSIGNASGIPGAGTLFGVTSAAQKFAMFNAFLSSIGQLKIKDKPRFTTTSGAPVQFENIVTNFYQTFQQTAASGGVGSAAVASNYVQTPYDTGMTLRLAPRYDVYTGLVRIPFTVTRKILNGWNVEQNPVPIGTTVQTITSKTPIINKTKNDGELLVKNNDLVIVSVMTEDMDTDNDSGATGLINIPIFKSLFGQGSRNKTTTTYYFAMRVTVTKKS